MTSYEPGSEIAGYRIESLIGRGGMAVVYRAEDMRLGRKVALKLLSPQLADNEQFRQRFIRESRLAASLDHPNIVPIYEAGDADGQLFIAMRYVVGSDLKGLLADQGGRLPLGWTLELFGQIGDALDSAHRAGLVHRDVKPGNILVATGEHPRHAYGDHVYLSDFGLTKRATEVSGGLTGTGNFLGTADYVSPEQIQGKPVGPGTDIYALGCVIYECLTGRPPFLRDDDAALLWAHLVETPPAIEAIRPEVPAGVSAVVARAMAKQPADRYATCQELVDDLELALDMGGAPTELGTVTGHAPSGGWHPSDPSARFGATAGASSETAPPAPRSGFAEHPGSDRTGDAGSPGDQRETVVPVAALPVDHSRLVAAAASTPTVAAKRPRPFGAQRRRVVARLIIIGVLAFALGAGALAVNLLRSGEPMSVVAEAATSSGGDPFTPPPPVTASSGSPAPATSPSDGGSARPPGTGSGAPTVTSGRDVPVSGATAGLYGGTRAEACNAESMASFFDAHPDRAAAWARAQGIRPSQIRPFLASLTPVVLRTDTAVTNHGFRNGRANAFQSVLQAGTAVMVDEHGVPRVRCSCGNPLDRPVARTHVRYTGKAWPELNHRPVTVVRPAPVIIQHFVVVVVEQNTTVVVDRLRGTVGDHDAPAAPEVVDAALKFSVDDPAKAATSDKASPTDKRTRDSGSASSPSTRTSPSSAGTSSATGTTSSGGSTRSSSPETTSSGKTSPSTGTTSSAGTTSSSSAGTTSSAGATSSSSAGTTSSSSEQPPPPAEPPSPPSPPAEPPSPPSPPAESAPPSPPPPVESAPPSPPPSVESAPPSPPPSVESAPPSPPPSVESAPPSPPSPPVESAPPSPPPPVESAPPAPSSG